MLHGKPGRLILNIHTMYRLSNDSQKLLGQPMFKVLAKVQELEKKWENIIHFEIWDPDFNTPPNITQAAIDALNQWKTHYTNSYGVAAFREVIAEATLHSRGFKPTLKQILVTPWANIILYYAVRCLVNPWDEVIIPDPGFPTYISAVQFCNAVPKYVPLFEKNDFKLQLSDLKNCVTDKTRLIILNSPSNPTGAVLEKEELVAIAQFAIDNQIFLLCDEIYSRLIFDATEFYSPSILDECKEYIIILNWFSKAFAMTGWRLWVAIWPEDVIEKMALLLQTTSSCVPDFIQYAGIEAIVGDQSHVHAMVKEYGERKDILVSWLNAIPWISCNNPHGAIYVFPNISGTGMTSDEFAQFALEKAKIAVLPWTNFWEYWEWFIRMCYVNSKANIIEWLSRLKIALEWNK